MSFPHIALYTFPANPKNQLPKTQFKSQKKKIYKWSSSVAKPHVVQTNQTPKTQFKPQIISKKDRSTIISSLVQMD
jgi:hypothetical protein